MSKVKALIVTGYGINCEKEMALAFEMAGAEATITHAELLLSNAIPLEGYHVMAFPGGFSFGDDLGAGKAFANRLSYSKKVTGENLTDRLKAFVEEGKCIFGVCNGFQLLVKLGLIPDINFGGKRQCVSLAHNSSSCFEARWTHLQVRQSPCVFTRGLEKLYLPVRHGEGKLVAESSDVVERLLAANHVVMQYSDSNGSVTMDYPHNPNGSIESIAGLCDSTGRIFGLMPHPEAALLFTNHPQWHRIKDNAVRNHEEVPTYGPGFALFKNAVDYIKENA